MKQRMREHNAVYGGELSSHHFFGDFHHCDSGMMAMLRMLQILKRTDATISELVAGIRQNNACTPEISLSLKEPERAFSELARYYSANATDVYHFDGLHFNFDNVWRFSITQSKTEPVVRFNFETREDGDSLLSNALEVMDRISPFMSDETKIADLLFIQ
jgi:phosphomannomutase